MEEKVTMNSKSPKVSVIMAVYNDFLYLEESIRSILNQTFTDFEFIIINDGSTKDIGERLEKIRREDSRVKIITHDRNLGLAKSLNDGIDLAVGEYIARMDADDLSQNTRLEKQVKYFDNNEHIVMLGTGSIRINKDGKTISKHIPPLPTEKLYEVLENHNPMVHPSIMFRSNKGLRYREKFMAVQDYDLYLRMKDENLSIENLSEPLIKYRIDNKHSDLRRVLKHISYQFLAIDFHRQRVEKGTDDYDKFNPEIYENLTLEKVNDRRIVKETVLALYKGSDIRLFREVSVFYLKKFGFDLIVLKSLFFTFLPTPIRNLLRSLSNQSYNSN